VVSAVGHETDFSICDFVADLRAPTPSAAAELVTPDQAALRETFQRAGRQLLRRMRDRLQRDGQRLDHLAHRLQQRHPASRLADQCRRLQALEVMAQRAVRRSLDDRAQRLRSVSARLAAQRPERRIADLSGRLAGARRALGRLALSAVQARQQQLGELARTLHAVSPLAVIGRGYAVLTSAKTGTVVSSVQQVDRGAGVLARLKDGRLDCRVESVLPADPDAP
jgi:exodeoxyribonuclease VII large subunit